MNIRPSFQDFNSVHEAATGRFARKVGGAGGGDPGPDGAAGTRQSAGRMTPGRKLLYRGQTAIFSGPGDISQRILITTHTGEQVQVYRHQVSPHPENTPNAPLFPGRGATSTPPPAPVRETPRATPSVPVTPQTHSVLPRDPIEMPLGSRPSAPTQPRYQAAGPVGAPGRMVANNTYMLGNTPVQFVGPGSISQRVQVRHPDGRVEEIYRKRLAPAGPIKLERPPEEPKAVASGIIGSHKKAIGAGGLKNDPTLEPNQRFKQQQADGKKAWENQLAPEIANRFPPSAQEMVKQVAVMNYEGTMPFHVDDMITPLEGTGLPKSNSLYLRGDGEIRMVRGFDKPTSAGSDVVARINGGSAREGTDYQITRTYVSEGDGGVFVKHDYFAIGKESQGKGIAKKFLRNSFEAYSRNNVTAVEVHAALDAGGYTWAKFGFSPSKEGWDRLVQNVSDNAMTLSRRPWESVHFGKRNPKIPYSQREESTTETWLAAHKFISSLPKKGSSIQALANSKWGKELLSGEDWFGTFDMSNKRQVDHFNAYTGSSIPVRAKQGRTLREYTERGVVLDAGLNTCVTSYNLGKETK